MNKLILLLATLLLSAATTPKPSKAGPLTLDAGTADGGNSPADAGPTFTREPDGGMTYQERIYHQRYH